MKERKCTENTPEISIGKIIGKCDTIPEVSLDRFSVKSASNIQRETFKVLHVNFPTDFLPFGLSNYDLLDTQNKTDFSHFYSFRNSN